MLLGNCLFVPVNSLVETPFECEEQDRQTSKWQGAFKPSFVCVEVASRRPSH